MNLNTSAAIIRRYDRQPIAGRGFFSCRFNSTTARERKNPVCVVSVLWGAYAY